jgi:serine/threonine protein kinase
MTKLKQRVPLVTAFESYVIDELIGEGGAGRVYGGVNSNGAPVAVKVLAADRASSDKKGRFKNEIAFLGRNTHANIVTVVDHGVATDGSIRGPFYVMQRYDGNLRDLMHAGVSPEAALPLFSQILDGVEAAHFLGAVHRDLKPENVLYTGSRPVPAVADFGIASFNEDLLATLVVTEPTQRLANFQYAAPEQRVPGKAVTGVADVYALGLMLNELFTGAVPHGTEYQSIGSISDKMSFLDAVVARMIRQMPSERPASIGEVKSLIQRHESNAVSLQRLSTINQTVIKAGEIDAPLARESPQLVGAEWNAGKLTLKLNRPVTQDWVRALCQMESYSCVAGVPPESFSFSGNEATARVAEHEAQQVINHFKGWLPIATNTFKHLLQQKAQREAAERRERLGREKVAEEQRLRVNRSLRI